MWGCSSALAFDICRRQIPLDASLGMLQRRPIATWPHFTTTVRCFAWRLASVFFWSIGGLAQLNIDQFAAEGGALKETSKVPLLFSLVIGVGLGSVLAGVWSHGRVELGILPLGAFGIALTSMMVFLVQGTIFDPESIWTTKFILACVLLFLLGSSAGLVFRSPRSISAASQSGQFEGRDLGCHQLFSLHRRTDSGVSVFRPALSHVRRNAGQSLARVPRFDTASAGARTDRSRSHAVCRQGWQSEPPPSLEDALEDIDPAYQSQALVELLWIEFEARGETDSPATKKEYYDRFPQHKPLVKAVHDQVSGLPLLTSQQIFLFAGIGTIPVFIYVLCAIPQGYDPISRVAIEQHPLPRARLRGRESSPGRRGVTSIQPRFVDRRNPAPID